MNEMMGPFDWFATPVHYQGLSLALGVGLTASVCTVFLSGALWSTALISVASTVMFIVISLPLMQIYWGLQWPWWLAVAAGWGIVSILAMRALIKAAQRIYDRTPDIVDGGLRRLDPSLTPVTGDRHD